MHVYIIKLLLFVLIKKIALFIVTFFFLNLQMLALINSLSTTGQFTHLDEPLNSFKTVPPDKLLFKSLTIDETPLEARLWSNKTRENFQRLQKLRIDDSSTLTRDGRCFFLLL